MAKIVTDATLQAFDGQRWLPIGEVKDFQWSVGTDTANLHGGRLPKLHRGQRTAPAWLVRRKKATKLRARWV